VQTPLDVSGALHQKQSVILSPCCIKDEGTLAVAASLLHWYVFTTPEAVSQSIKVVGKGTHPGRS
jgi:hypothetical protein